MPQEPAVEPPGSGGVQEFVDRLLISDKSFTGKVGVGVRNTPKRGRISWVILEIDSGSCGKWEVEETDIMAKPEEVLEVVLGVSASEETWNQISDGTLGFLDAVDKNRFFISGEAPFFIRHLEGFVQIMKAF